VTPDVKSYKDFVFPLAQSMGEKLKACHKDTQALRGIPCGEDSKPLSSHKVLRLLL
jgi:hypothetical protein